MKTSKTTFNISFLGRRPVMIAVVLSTVFIGVSLVSLATRGLNLGLDFTGGAIVELAYGEPVDIANVRKTLAQGGLGDATVQAAEGGRNLIVRLPPTAANDADAGERIARTLTGATVQRIEFVGPQIGDELREDGGLAMLYAIAGIILYLMQRFNWRFSLGATVATLHDAFVVLGFFALAGLTFDLTIVAAILTVMGYSLNDTIVIFDRVRENARRPAAVAPVDLFNTSINQTLARTFITSGTTLLVVLSMYFLGGETLRGFAIALIVGIISGTYSTLYIASPVTIALGFRGADDMQRPVVEAAAEGRP